MICSHGIHMDNACGACEPPRGTTVRGWGSCVMGPARPAIEERYTREGAEARRGAPCPYHPGSAAATWWKRGNAGVDSVDLTEPPTGQSFTDVDEVFDAIGVPPTDQRQRFEAWADDQGFPLKRLDTSDGYLDLRTHGAWDAWQAATAGVPETPALSERKPVAYHDKDQPNGIAWCPGYPEGLADITPLYAGEVKRGKLSERIAAEGAAGVAGAPALERVLAGLDYFLMVKGERRFIEGARNELVAVLAAGVAVPQTPKEQ